MQIMLILIYNDIKFTKKNAIQICRMNFINIFKIKTYFALMSISLCAKSKVTISMLPFSHALYNGGT